MSLQRVLLLVGPPGSGKSTFAHALIKTFPNFVRINQDDLGDRTACEAMTLSALQTNNQSVVIDRCNFDKSQRKVWIDLARQLNISRIDVIVMNTEFYQCKLRILARTEHPTQVNGQNGVEILHHFLERMTRPEPHEGLQRILWLDPQTTPEYTEEAVKEIMERLDKIDVSEKAEEAPRWHRDDLYFKTQYVKDEEAYRARKAASWQKRNNNHLKGPEVDSDGFSVMKRHGHHSKEDEPAASPARPPLFGGASNGGWRAREAAKKQQQEQTPKKFGPTIQEVARPDVANPFDLLGDEN
ncbi:hypothetical protein BGW38_001048 [Lunasporangiospora selenospora]|uniref:AAA domain-containing protein n=1 Tax=Lunasporangiospora selenospora TaxID=979761 RepID=A0A9P6FTZ7_9FUNG|nr:hypothetical protein BGW38_001048 [Lunasporangiospora selenospora]